jgi:hypothetical protein
MDTGIWDEILHARITSIQATLTTKAKEYSSNKDRLYVFNRAAEIAETTPAKALLGMMLKHWVSVLDLIEDEDYVLQDLNAYEALINEKIGDSINYLILLEAILKEPLYERISVPE